MVLNYAKKCFGGLKLVIMSDQNEGLLYVVPKVFALENHTFHHVFEGQLS